MEEKRKTNWGDVAKGAGIVLGIELLIGGGKWLVNRFRAKKAAQQQPVAAPEEKKGE